MNPAVQLLLAPLALLLPAGAGVDAPRDQPDRPGMSAAPIAATAAEPPKLAVPPAPRSRFDLPESGVLQLVFDGYRSTTQQQVSIEQRVTIRIAPRPPAAASMLNDLPRNGFGPRFTERKMGRCLPISGIAGVQYRDTNKLILFLRDRRIVSLTLEKACRARDFYSGFYVPRDGDGMLCAGRDEIRSRSGSSCELSGMRQLIEIEE